MQSTVSQARGDTSVGTVTAGTKTAAANTSTATNNTLTFDVGGGEKVSINTYTHTNATVSTLTAGAAAVGTADLSAAAFSINDGTGATAITFASGDNTTNLKVAKINSVLSAAGKTVQAAVVGGKIQLTNSTGATITVTSDAASTTDLGFTTGAASTDGAVAVNVALTNTQLAAAINANSALAGKVSASETGGVLTMNNLSTSTAVTGLAITTPTSPAIPLTAAALPPAPPAVPARSAIR